MSKQTAVEWLIEQIHKDLIHKSMGQIFGKAMQMEKEQIIEAHGVKESYGAEGSKNLWHQTTGEEFYKEQYERQDNKH